MRTIRLEILRHGPSHNQLLSPLTEYFALCENHPAVTVRLPFEHAEFLARLRAEHETSAAPGRFFEIPDHFRVGMGVNAEMFREGLRRVGLAL